MAFAVPARENVLLARIHVCDADAKRIAGESAFAVADRY
jgi:hypothetical protein